ncbi:hypothetical protein C5955_15315 [Cronobacter sakazakii]|nr:hypothetical protein C5955_15315 [Cronobacter sakazakii]
MHIHLNISVHKLYTRSLPGGTVRQHLLYREREHRVPRGERAVAKRVMHFRQVAVFVVAVYPATTLSKIFKALVIIDFVPEYSAMYHYRIWNYRWVLLIIN